MKEEPAVGVLVGSVEARRRAMSYAAVLSIVAIGAVASCFWIWRHGVTWVEVSAFAVFYVLSSVGQGVALHRYFSHKSFRTSQAGRVALAILATMSMQGPIIGWVADHRRHHAHTDDCGDLHSPHIDDHCRPLKGLRGLLHAQFGWLFADTFSDPRIFAKDLVNDRMLLFFGRTRIAWYLLSIIVLPGLYGYVVGGVHHMTGAILVGGMLRAVVFSQSILALNSIGHTHGQQRFAHDNSSRNNVWLAVLTLGEGWHNNHHRFPRNAYAGIAWYEFDPLGRIISIGEKLGIFRDVVRVAHLDTSQRIVPQEAVKSGLVGETRVERRKAA